MPTTVSPIKIGFVMDPIESFNLKKDSTIAMLRAASAKGWEIYYWQVEHMYIDHSDAMATMSPLQINPDKADDQWYTLGEPITQRLSEMDVIMMRKDPPFDMHFIHATYILDLAAKQGSYVVNPPNALRDCNEKLFTTWFPDCMPPTLISHQRDKVREFLDTHGDIIVKPPNGMGGAGIFRLQKDMANTGVILETLLPTAKHTIVAQKYIPAVTEGDKRILLINGEPIPYGLARIPAKGETRANLAVGGRGEGQELTERERWICDQVKPELIRRGLMFVGLDVIGGFLTEVNVTSPTGIRELDAQFDLDIGGTLMDAIEQKLEQKIEQKLSS